MKRFVFLFGIFVSFGISAQNWIKSNGTGQHEEILDATHDNDGNLILGGYHSSEFDIGGSILQAGGVSQGLLIKTTSIGSMTWAKNIGKFGADRIYAVTTDDDGNIFSTGYVSGSFDQDGIPVVTNNNSRDIFIAKHDPNGNLLWLKTAGGPNGDTGYGLDTDSDGNVFVTGQFKGNAVFGSTNLQGSFDDINNLETFEFFVSKLDPAGNFLWTKKGSAKFNDRGMSVAVDQNDDVYIGGQFSDTLTFDNTHNNSVMNAGFLMKLDNDGNELWFSKLAGVQSILYDVKLDGSDNPVVTGDFIGAMLIHGIGNQIYSNSNFTYNVMVAKYNPQGEVLWLKEEGSESEVTSKQLTIDQHGNIYTSGTFRCRFDEFSQEHGTGIFYSMGYRDVFSVAYNSNGTRLWKEHYGGPKDDYCSAITMASTDNIPTIAGSFERQFNFSTGNSIYVNSSFDAHQYSYNYCGSNNYQNYGELSSFGAKDIFYGKIRNTSNGYLDYFVRDPSGACVQDSIAPCIALCLDTVELCDEGHLPLTSFTYDRGYFAPILLANWQNEGFGIAGNYYVDQSGTYSVVVSREDECWVNHPDTVEVIIHNTPEPPRMTDDWGININQPPLTTPLEWCHPDTAIIHVDNFSAADTATWSNADALNFINDSTIQVTSTGEYKIDFYNDFGCSSSNRINVAVDTFAIHDTLQPHIHFVDPVLEATDTIEICIGDGVGVYLIDSLFFDITNGNTPHKKVYWSINSPASMAYDSTEIFHYNVINTSVTGDYIVNAHLQNLCGDTVDYFLSRYLHIIVHPNPVVTGNITGPTGVCPGDSIMLYYNSTGDNFSVSGPNIIEDFGDSMLVLATNSISQYSIQGSVTDSITGCSSTFANSYSLYPRLTPQITLNPPHGIVCPDDSVELTALTGVAWEWIGPDDNGFANTQTTYGHTPGFYHAIVTDADGCVMTSNFVEAKEYSTPEIFAEPEVICAGETSEIKVLGSSFTTVNWQAPLSGNSFIQTVSAPGTYICEMELCNITTIDSVTISISEPIGIISTQDELDICPNDTVTILANGGMIEYQWQDNSQQDFIFATQAGDYWVIVTNEYGCKDTSNVISIGSLPAPAAPITSDTSVCLGNDAVLTASASNEVMWYENPSSNLLATGNSFSVLNVTEPQTFYIRTEDSLCSSEWSTATLGVYESSVTPIIYADTHLCIGSDLILTNNTTQELDFYWVLPDNSTSNQDTLFVPTAQLSDAGVYTLAVSDSLCASDTASFSVAIIEYPTANLNYLNDTILCFGESLQLELTNLIDSNEVIWQPNLEQTSSIEISEAGSYFATISNGYCEISTDTIQVLINNQLEASFIADTILCEGNNLILSDGSNPDLSFYWEFPDGTTSNQHIFELQNLSQADTGSYSVFVADSICSSDTISFQIDVIPYPVANLDYLNDTILCYGETLDLSLNDFDANLDVTWYPNLENTSNLVLTESGTYFAEVSFAGCSVFTDTIDVVVHNEIQNTFVADTLICPNNDVTLFTQDSAQVIWFNENGDSIHFGSSLELETLLENQYFGYAIVDSTGCSSELEEAVVYVAPTDSAPPIYIEGTACEGTAVTLSSINYPNLNYSWILPDGSIVESESIFILDMQDSLTGTYQLSVELNGCLSDTQSIQLNYYVADSIYLPEDTTICQGDVLTMQFDDSLFYDWSFGSDVSIVNISDAGLVTVNVTNEFGCVYQDSVLVNLLNCDSLVPTNVFTPNNDGVNDVFYFYIEETQMQKVEVRNRFGNIVYKQESSDKIEWDGRDYRTGVELSSGTYFYMFEYQDWNGQWHQLNGFLTLIRD